MEHTGRYYEVLAHQLSEANLFVSAINPKLIKDFDNDSLRKVKSDKADAVKIARYALDKWQNLKQYSVMDELRNQLKTMNRQFGFYMKHKTAMKNNLIGILDQTYPSVNTYSTILYLHNTLAHIVYQAFFMQMTIRVLISQKHNTARKIYNKQAGAPAPAPLTISLFHSTPPQALPPGSPAPSHPHTSRTTHHSVPQPSHGSPAPYRSHAKGFFHPPPAQR